MVGFHSKIFAKTCLVFISFITIVLAEKKCNFNVKVKQVLLNEGYHRNITYVIMLSEDYYDEWSFQNCQVGLDQELPPGVYVNTDELGELRRLRRLKALTKNRINVELPAEESETTNTYIMGHVQDNVVSLWLPVHARYAKAKPGGGKARNTILPPKLFIRCPDQRLDMCGDTVPPTTTYLCSGVVQDKCIVVELQYTMLTDVLVWDVPVGDRDHYYAIAFGTSLAVMSGSLYLLRAVHEAKIYLRNLLRRM